MDYGGALGNIYQSEPDVSEQERVSFILSHGSVENQDSSDTLTLYSSDSSSSDDFFRVNPQILPEFTVQNKPPQYNISTKSFFAKEEIDISSEALYRLEESINGSPGSNSQFSDITHESLIPQFSPTQSPSIQIMEKCGDFDPNRIPISVFSKSSTPTEWSVASNDSLFSIHIGDNSFSRDRILKIDVDLQKSGELLRFEELSKSSRRSGELIRLGPTSLSFNGIKPNLYLENSTIAEDVKLEGIQVVDEKIIDGSNDEPVNNRVDTIIRDSGDSYGSIGHSDKSEIHVLHFAKPVKKKSSANRMWHCQQDCCSWKWLSCSCKWFGWPSCSFKWFNTTCFKWPSCHFQVSTCVKMLL